MFRRNTVLLSCAAVLLVIQVVAVTAQQSVKSPNPMTDWPMFSHDLAGTRFSSLKQINAGNVGKLKLAWRMPYRADRNAAGGGPGGGLTEATPIVVDAIMYAVSYTHLTLPTIYSV